MGTLAYIYREDKMVKNDHTAALWSRLAAGAGDSEGMYSLGIMYEQGRGGLPKDASQAVSWYRKAADAGDSDAMYALGTIYEQGRGGLPKDIPQAVSWYRKAAKAEFVTDNAKQALQRLGY
jgi:TPR repeat protein